jgi:preprotein translocase subunit SecY
MEVSETINLLQKKILKIFGFLILIRLGLYIPVPNVDLDIFFSESSRKSSFWTRKKFNWKFLPRHWFIRYPTLY